LPNTGLITFHQAVIRRIDAAHAGDEYKVAGARTEAPGSRRRKRALWRENANAAPGIHQGVPV